MIKTIFASANRANRNQEQRTDRYWVTVTDNIEDEALSLSVDVNEHILDTDWKVKVVTDTIVIR